MEQPKVITQDRQVASLKPADGKDRIVVKVQSKAGPGLSVKSRAGSQTKSWLYRPYLNGKQIKVTLGAYPAMSWLRFVKLMPKLLSSLRKASTHAMLVSKIEKQMRRCQSSRNFGKTGSNFALPANQSARERLPTTKAPSADTLRKSWEKFVFVIYPVHFHLSISAMYVRQALKASERARREDRICLRAWGQSRTTEFGQMVIPRTAQRYSSTAK